MANRFNDPLLLAGKVISILMQVAMAVGAVALLVATGGILLFGEELAAEAGLEAFPAGFPIVALAGIMLIGLVIVALLFVFFGKLRHIIDTVGAGDPFQPANADRLNLMAWLMLGAQLVALPAAALGVHLARLADGVERVDVDVDGALDPTGIMLIIVLFILARVFRHGAAMREDLEGTV